MPAPASTPRAPSRRRSRRSAGMPRSRRSGWPEPAAASFRATTPRPRRRFHFAIPPLHSGPTHRQPEQTLVTERLVITRLAHRGDGVADTPAGPLFVPYTLPGETVTVERMPGQPDRRHLVNIEAASPERIAPVCPHFGTCGGCA